MGLGMETRRMPSADFCYSSSIFVIGDVLVDDSGGFLRSFFEPLVCLFANETEGLSVMSICNS